MLSASWQVHVTCKQYLLSLTSSTKCVSFFFLFFKLYTMTANSFFKYQPRYPTSLVLFSAADSFCWDFIDNFGDITHLIVAKYETFVLLMPLVKLTARVQQMVHFLSERAEKNITLLPASLSLAHPSLSLQLYHMLASFLLSPCNSLNAVSNTVSKYALCRRVLKFLLPYSRFLFEATGNMKRV